MLLEMQEQSVPLSHHPLPAGQFPVGLSFSLYPRRVLVKPQAAKASAQHHLPFPLHASFLSLAV